QDLSPAMGALGFSGSKAPPMPGVIKGGKGRSRIRQETSEEVIARSKDPKLGEYIKKRDLSVTPEPGPSPDTPAEGNSFVIQKHRATRLHYDLRLERDGVLVSWAVPTGPPTRRRVRHLAIQTEDHPLEYASFEGNIPTRHSGDGEMVIGDRGRYEL